MTHAQLHVSCLEQKVSLKWNSQTDCRITITVISSLEEEVHQRITQLEVDASTLLDTKTKKKSQKQTMLQWDMSLHTWLYWMYHIKAHLSNVLYTSFCHCIIFCTFLHHFHSQLQLLYMLNVFLTFKAILFSMLLFSVFLPPDLMSFIWLIFFSLCIYYYYKQIHPKQILCTLFLLYSVFDLTSALEHHSVSSSWGRCPPTSESAQHSLRWPEERAQKLLSLMTNYMEALNIFDIWNWYKCC